MKNKNNMSKIFIIVFALISTTSLFAQAAFDDDVVDAGGVVGIPLDGGLSLLVAGAAVYGIMKLRENKNE